MNGVDFDWTDAGDAEDHACKLEAVAKKILAIWGYADANDLHIAAQCIRGLADDVERLSSMASRLEAQRNGEHHGPHCAGSCEGAAYQIEIRKLRSENEALREALEMLLRYIETGDMRKVDLRVARSALAAHDKEEQ